MANQNSNFNSRLVTLSNLTERERSIAYGGCLGDSTIQTRSKTTARIRFHHSQKHAPYVIFKYKQMQRLCATTQPPVLTKKTKDGYQGVEFYVSTAVWCRQIYDLFFRPDKDGKMIRGISEDLLKQIPVTPLTLAFLFMDDGSVRDDCYAGKIATQCFTLAEHELLRDWLLSSYDLRSQINKHTVKSGQYYLAIKAADFGDLISIIEPEVRLVPCMEYKLNELRSTMQ